MAKRKYKSVVSDGFRGMANLRAEHGHFTDRDLRKTTPAYVLNADITEDGAVRARKGYTKKISLTRCHSLWADSVMLCVAAGADGTPALYRVWDNSAKALSYIHDPCNATMYYAEYGSLVYMSNGYWAGVYDIAANTVRDWGLSIPPAPIAQPATGNLPPGAYHLCYTTYSGTRVGGNSAILQVRWMEGTNGIQLLNQPTDAYVWITQPNTGEFFKATVTNGVISTINSIEPLETLDVTTVPFLQYIIVAHGRMFGARGHYLYYSDPGGQFEWFRRKNKIYFPEELTMVAPINGGIYVASLDRTWVLDGTDVAKMQVKEIGYGAIPNTLVYSLVEGAGYEISKELSQVASPLWMSKGGIVVGTQTGKLVHVSERTVRINPLETGASLQRDVDGRSQVLITLRGAPLKKEDKELSYIFETGKIFE